MCFGLWEREEWEMLPEGAFRDVEKATLRLALLAFQSREALRHCNRGGMVGLDFLQVPCSFVRSREVVKS